MWYNWLLFVIVLLLSDNKTKLFGYDRFQCLYTYRCYNSTLLCFDMPWFLPTHPFSVFFVQVMTFVYKICEIGRLGYSVFVFISTAIYISTNSWFKGMKRERHTFPRMVRNCYMYCKGTLIKHWWIHYMDYWIVK